MKEKIIAVLMGGISNEREVSIATGTAIYKALMRKGYNVIKIDINERSLKWLKNRFDIAFIALHGKYGEDGIIQGILEYMNIPYTGTNALGSAVSMDKVISKRLFMESGIPTGKFWDEQEIDKIKYPIVVKPVAEGSTIGISIVHNKEDIESAIKEAKKVSNEIYFEEYLEGREVTVSLLNGEALPVIEIKPKNKFYDFKAKYTKGMTEYIVPAKLNDKLNYLLKKYSEKIFKVFKLKGVARVDYIIRENIPYALEVNTIPGMTETSLLPKAAKCAGMEFEDLVEKILLDIKGF